MGKVVLNKIVTESWSSVVIREKGNRRSFLSNDIIGISKYVRDSGFLNTCGTRTRDARDALFGMRRYDALFSRSSAVSESALLRKKGQIKKALDALLMSFGDDDNYDMSRWRTCENTEWLKSRG